jgi:hypothetical protein
MLDNDGIEKLRTQLEACNDSFWVELVVELHKFKTSSGDEAWFFFLIDDPAQIPPLAKLYIKTVQDSVLKHYPETEFFMGVYQHHDGKELFWGEINSNDIIQGKLNDGFGHDPIENPLPDADLDVFSHNS